MPRLFVFFEDLCNEEVVNNWTTLNRWIEELGFPPGRMLGRRRAWTPEEIKAWFETLPTNKNAQSLRGGAKRNAEAAKARVTEAA